MSKSKPPVMFGVGDTVRVKPGIADPDYPDIPLGGWAGTITEVEDGDSRAYLVMLNERTLNNIHPIYRKRCERDGLKVGKIWLLEEDLESDTREPAPVAQPTNIVSRPLSMDDQDDRIRSIFGRTRDDPVPEANDDSVAAYYKDLVAN